MSKEQIIEKLCSDFYDEMTKGWNPNYWPDYSTVLKSFKAGYAASQAAVGQRVGDVEIESVVAEIFYSYPDDHTEEESIRMGVEKVKKLFHIIKIDVGDIELWKQMLLEYGMLQRMEENTLKWNINILMESYNLSPLTSPATVSGDEIKSKQDFVDWFFSQKPYWPTPHQCYDWFMNTVMQPPVSGKEVVSKRDFVSWFYNQKPYFPTPHQCYDWFIQNNKTLTNDI